MYKWLISNYGKKRKLNVDYAFKVNVFQYLYTVESR